MCKYEIMFWLRVLYNSISSDFVANILSFGSLVVAIAALVIGGKKVSEALEEYKRKKRTAVFSYHTNMRIFIMRLKRLVTDSQSKPSKSMYLYSSETQIREMGIGYEKMAEKLANLSQKMLDYLSTESDQIPASSEVADVEEWDNLMDGLVGFLSDFLLYDTNSYLPDFDNEENIANYHNELTRILDSMSELIEQSKENLKREMS